MTRILSVNLVRVQTSIYLIVSIPDAEMCGPLLSDNFSNSDDGQANANACGGGYNDEDDDNED
jgi:hypothetical protein